jgi:hypothetical protein
MTYTDVTEDYNLLFPPAEYNFMELPLVPPTYSTQRTSSGF